MGMKRLLAPRAVIAAFTLAVLSLQYHFPHFPSPNEYSRLYLLEAIVEDGTLAIDRPLARHRDIEDKVVFAGRTYSNKPPGLTLLALPAYALASLTALARMEDSKHYASDVIAGAFLGIIVGRLVTPSGDNTPHRLQLVAGPSQAGLQLSF